MNETNQTSPGGTGYLIVRVSTALGAIPVENATVTVRSNLTENLSGTDRGSIIQVLTSNRDGNTPRIALDAPARSNSMSPGNAIPYATYNIDIEADGFYRQYFSNVPIYDGVTSIQPATLAPLAQNPNLDRVTDGDRYFDENVNPELRPLPPQT